MKRVLRRTAYAKRQATQKKAAQWKKVTRTEDNKAQMQSRVLHQYFKDIRWRGKTMYREDWQLGPIAPKRDVGEWRETFAVTPNDFRHPPPLTSLERKALKARPHYIEPHDYVVVLTGKDKGKIDIVKQVDHENMAITVKNLNKYDFAMPAFVREKSPNEPLIHSDEVPYRADQVRLVHNLVSKSDGESSSRDVIVEAMSLYKPDLSAEGISLEHEAYRGKDKNNLWSYDWASSMLKRFPFLTQVDVRPIRYIAGHGPSSTASSTDEAEDPTLIKYEDPPIDEDIMTYEADTPAEQIEQDPSYVFALDEEPFPAPVLDELRNKYSRFRSRHDLEYIEKKEADDAQELRQRRLKLYGQKYGPSAQVRVHNKTGRMKVRQKPSGLRHQKNLNRLKPSEGQLKSIGELIARTKAAKLTDKPASGMTT